MVLETGPRSGMPQVPFSAITKSLSINGFDLLPRSLCRDFSPNGCIERTQPSPVVPDGLFYPSKTYRSIVYRTWTMNGVRRMNYSNSDFGLCAIREMNQNALGTLGPLRQKAASEIPISRGCGSNGSSEKSPLVFSDTKSSCNSAVMSCSGASHSDGEPLDYFATMNFEIFKERNEEKSQSPVGPLDLRSEIAAAALKDIDSPGNGPYEPCRTKIPVSSLIDPFQQGDRYPCTCGSVFSETPSWSFSGSSFYSLTSSAGGARDVAGSGSFSSLIGTGRTRSSIPPSLDSDLFLASSSSSGDSSVSSSFPDSAPAILEPFRSRTRMANGDGGKDLARSEQKSQRCHQSQIVSAAGFSGICGTAYGLDSNGNLVLHRHDPGLPPVAPPSVAKCPRHRLRNVHHGYSGPNLHSTSLNGNELSHYHHHHHTDSNGNATEQSDSGCCNASCYNACNSNGDQSTGNLPLDAQQGFVLSHLTQSTSSTSTGFSGISPMTSSVNSSITFQVPDEAIEYIRNEMDQVRVKDIEIFNNLRLIQLQMDHIRSHIVGQEVGEDTDDSFDDAESDSILPPMPKFLKVTKAESV